MRDSILANGEPIQELPAQGLTGIAVKLLTWADMNKHLGKPFEDLDWEVKFAMAELADAKRLGGGLAPA